MGSLPNLHELGKEHLVQISAHHPKIGPALSNPHQHSVGHSILTEEERNKVLHRHSTHCRTKRNASVRRHQGQTLNYDDLVLEHMATYSPISARSARNCSATRRRDSLSSSIGANSVRRLIAVVRHASGRTGPALSRRALLRNLTLVCATHALVTASFLPFLALQGAATAWIAPPAAARYPLDVGALLLALLHLVAALASFLGPTIVARLGANRTIVLGYAALLCFHLLHLYPALGVLVVAYAGAGVCLGPLCVARVTFLLTLSAQLGGEENEDVRTGRRTSVLRRVARAFRAAQDLGLIVGSLLAAVVINLTLDGTRPDWFEPVANHTARADRQRLDDLFAQDEFGDRICGAQTCPPTTGAIAGGRSVLPGATTLLLVLVNAAMALVATCGALFLDRIQPRVYKDGGETKMAALRAIGRGFRDPALRISGVLAFFIGVEQAFMYTDFSKFYVVCTLGLHRLNLVFFAMGLLQSIAACTLSMLLRTIRRYYVIFVGFAFHACLLMVQLLWKPIGDDPALFYVIGAAWGVCNAVWEMMNFTLLTSIYADNWEAPFAHCIAFRLLGVATAFVLHGHVCTWLKLYLLAALLLAAAIPSAILERQLENVRRVRGASRL